MTTFLVGALVAATAYGVGYAMGWREAVLGRIRHNERIALK